jgi:hypothetical protein
MSTTTVSKEGIDQVREIIVGAIQRDLERKMARMESHLATRLGELQQEARRRTEVIEAHLRRELDALSTRFDAELEEVKEIFRSLTKEHREAKVAIEQRTAKLEESFVRGNHDLRNQILEQAKKFLDELQVIRDELTETLERELATVELEPGGEESKAREPREAGEPAHQ